MLAIKRSNVPNSRTVIASELSDQDVVATEFDEPYYLLRYKSFLEEYAGPPLPHFIQYGWTLDFDPNPWFSTKDYLELYEDVRAAGHNPFVHFLRHGRAEGRAPNRRSRDWNMAAAEFDTEFYMIRYPEIAGRAVEPIQHYLDEGWKEERDPAPWFSTRHYLNLNPDVRIAGENPFLHFLLTGRDEGRSPSPGAEAADLSEGAEKGATISTGSRQQRGGRPDDGEGAVPYASPEIESPATEDAPEVAAGVGHKDRPSVALVRAGRRPRDATDRDGGTPFVVTLDDGDLPRGFDERLVPLIPALKEFFDEEFYLSRYPDIRGASVNPFVHFLRYGWKEGRAPNACFNENGHGELKVMLALPRDQRPAFFDPKVRAGLTELLDEAYYRRANSDVVTAGMNPLHHFVLFGAREKRNPSKEFRTDVYTKLYPSSLQNPEGPAFEFLKLPTAERDNRLRRVAEWRGPTSKLPAFRRYSVANGIFLAVHDAHPTGAPMIALNLLRMLTREYRIPVVTILLDSSGALQADFAAESSEVIEYDNLLRSTDGNPTAAWGEIAQRLLRYQITTGICNSVVCGQVVEKLAGLGFTCLALVHELMDSVIGFGWERYAENIVKQAVAIVFPGNFVRDRFLERYGTPRGKVCVMGQPPNLKIEDLRPRDAMERRSRLRVGLRLTDNDFLVLSAGAGDFRKGIDLFVQTAVTALERAPRNGRRLYFVWLGNVASTEAVWIKKDLRAQGLEDRVLFPGAQREGVADYFVASDLFFLPSREDPYPTVVIEAMHAGLPVVAFEGTGGVVEQVAQAGYLVPYGDWSHAADLVVELSSADLRDRRAAAQARAATFSIPEAYAADLLNLLQFGLTREERLNERPRSELIGVGVPAFQCCDYIEERLWSIFEQSLVPGEIFIVDDDSDDATPEAIDRLRALAPCPLRFVENVRNSGSPFPQWKRCLEELDSEFVWIAESDDSARLRFLEDLAPFMREGQDVQLIYAKTATMDVYSEENPAGHDSHLRSVASLSRWETTYLLPGQDEIREVLAFENTIPNISACLVRRSAALMALNGVGRYKTAGDWLFYLNLLRDGRIAFCRETLNLHRRHGRSVITRLEAQPIFHIERAGAHIRALGTGRLGPADAERMIERENKEFARLHDIGKAAAERGYLDLMQRMLREGDGGLAPDKRRVLVIIPDLRVGGGQIAGIRLANALAEQRHYVAVYIVDHSAGHGNLVDRIDPRVAKLPHGDFPQLLSFVEAAQIELISSHVWWSDKLAFGLKKERPETRWLMTMHGCYERILQEPEIDPWFFNNVDKLLRAADGIAYLADKNLAVFKEFGIPVRTHRVRKVYNGMAVPEEVSAALERKRQPGRAARSFVMVGRGIEEKGWREAAEALRQTNARLAAERRRPVTLTFVGSGDYLARLQREERLRSLPIRYTGAVEDVFPLLASADVGLLPSYFPQESLPNAVAEYLLCRVPAIVTMIGEVPAMIASEKGDAGVVIGFKNGRADIDALAAAMHAYATDRALFAEHVERTAFAAGKFAMGAMLHHYADLSGVAIVDMPLATHEAELQPKPVKADADDQPIRKPRRGSSRLPRAAQPPDGAARGELGDPATD